MQFAWDPNKADRNFTKHGVAFEESSTVFADPLSLTGADPDHSATEQRWITFGESSSGRMLAVSHTEHAGAIRIISARLMTRSERRIYEEG